MSSRSLLPIFIDDQSTVFIQQIAPANAGRPSRLHSYDLGPAWLRFPFGVTITAENLFSWPVAVWLGVSALIITAVWLTTRHVRVMWQRSFCRAAVIALCLTPLPALEMFTEAAMGGLVAVVPLWYALFWSITHLSVLGVILVFVAWLVVTYVVWVAGMSTYPLLRKAKAAEPGASPNPAARFPFR